MKASKQTIARTVILVLALINQILSSTGHAVIPIADGDIEQVVSLIFTIVITLRAWWKNNSFTTEAIMADEYKKELKGIGNGK